MVMYDIGKICINVFKAQRPFNVHAKGLKVLGRNLLKFNIDGLKVSWEKLHVLPLKS